MKEECKKHIDILCAPDGLYEKLEAMGKENEELKGKLDNLKRINKEKEQQECRYLKSMKIDADNIERLERENEELKETIEACEKEVAEVYCYITKGKISKMNTMGFEVINIFEELWKEIEDE